MPDATRLRSPGSTTCGGKLDGAGGFLQGDVTQWIEELTDLAVVHGMDTFVFGPSDDPVRQLERFTAEVAPAVRDQVARHRSHQPAQ